jgi:hypothetical protein
MYLTPRHWQMHTIFSNHKEVTGCTSPLDTKATVLLFTYLWVTLQCYQYHILHCTDWLDDMLKTNWKGTGGSKCLIKVLTWHFPGRTKVNHKKTLGRLTDVPSKIWTKHMYRALLLQQSAHINKFSCTKTKYLEYGVKSCWHTCSSKITNFLHWMYTFI